MFTCLRAWPGDYVEADEPPAFDPESPSLFQLEIEQFEKLEKFQEKILAAITSNATSSSTVEVKKEIETSKAKKEGTIKEGGAAVAPKPTTGLKVKDETNAVVHPVAKVITSGAENAHGARISHQTVRI